MDPVRPLVIAFVASVSVALAGCGGQDEPSRQAQEPTQPTSPCTAPQPAPGSSTPAGPLEAPREVPREGAGPADPASVTVIEGWAKALVQGRIERAAAFFAVPSKVQNGTPVLTVSSQRAAQAFNEALPCGATITETQRAGEYTLVTYELTERPGGDCMGAAGALAFGAIKVSDGKIVEWYRLPGTGGETRPPARPRDTREI